VPQFGEGNGKKKGPAAERRTQVRDKSKKQGIAANRYPGGREICLTTGMRGS